MPERRKEAERALHDALRGGLKDDGAYAANKKFYAIGRSNHAFTRSWLAERCRGRRVLDYCCGNGDTALFAAEQGAAESHGIDISPVSIANAVREAEKRGLADRVKFEVGDAESTAYPNGHFDVIAVGGVLHHLDLEKAYRELARILRDDGVVLCVEALRHNPLIHLYRKMTPHVRSAWETEHILGRREILAAGKYFGTVRTERFFHLATLAAVPFRTLPVFDGLLSIFEGLDSVLLRAPGLKWQAWQVVFSLSRPKRGTV